MNRVVDVPPNKRSAYVVTQFDTLAPADRSCDGETNKSVIHVREISTAWIYTVPVVYRVSVPWRRASIGKYIRSRQEEEARQWP